MIASRDRCRTWKIAVLLAFSFFSLGFDENDARAWIDGEWEGGAAAWSLSVDSKAKTGIFIDGGKRLSGAFLIDEIVARGVRFHIGAQQFTMHFQCSDSARLSVGDGPDFGMQKVK